MKTTLKTFAATLLLGATLAPTTAAAQDLLLPKKPYKAEAVVTSGGQSVPVTFYSRRDAMRVEMRPGGQTVVNIVDMKSGEAFMLTEVAGQKTAFRLDASDALKAYGLGDADLPRATGRDKIAGQRCKIYVMDTGEVCLTRHNIPLASTAPDGSTMRVTTLDIGRQKAALFEVPKDYTVKEMGAMGGMIDPSAFSRENLLSDLFGQAGIEDGDGGFMAAINAIVNAEDDDAATQAAVDAMLGRAGLPAGSVTANDTTAGLLIEGIDSQMTDEDRAAQAAWLAESERQRKLMEQGGMEAVFRDRGMSEADIAQMRKSMQALQAHAEKAKTPEHQARIEAGTAEMLGAIPTEEEVADVEARMNELGAEAQAILDSGREPTEAEKDRLEREAEKALMELLGK